MPVRFKNPEKIIRTAAIALALYLVAFGIAMAFFPIRPFWNDEWRLIYNLKFKTIPQLWGRLDLLQECPRVYLTIIKAITSFFDYSYISLRLPALVICIVNIFFVFSLRKKLFPGDRIYSYLFVLIIISSQTFTDYIVQVKQYEMDIFACLLALWQLLFLLKIGEEGMQGNKGKYLLLCMSFLLMPFFSYTYPIAIAPVFPVILLLAFAKKEGKKLRSLFWLLLPLLLVTISIVAFYLVDVKHMMANTNMYRSYLHMLHNEKGEKHYIEDFWYLFALVGSGYVYEIVFGILGILAFFYGIYKLTISKKIKRDTTWYVQVYCIVLLLITIYLLVSGKIIGGVARLTAYAVPAIAILIVNLLNRLQLRLAMYATIIAIGLFLGLAGNIITTCIGRFTYPEYCSHIKTYWNTSKALQKARLNKIPILYTAAIDGDKKDKDAPAPGSIQTNEITPEQIAGVDRVCPEVILKVNPGYKVWDPIPVYEIPDTKWINNYMQQLPSQYTSAIVCDGVTRWKQQH